MYIRNVHRQETFTNCETISSISVKISNNINLEDEEHFNK